MKQLTIKDIARLCDSSVSTVSRVINGHRDVSDEMRVRVLDVIERYGYIPNNSARNLVKLSSDTIALVIRGVSNPFFTRVVKGVEREIRPRGYTMILHQIGSDEDEIKAAAALAREKRLCGILLLGGRFNYSPEETELLGVPFVCCTHTNTFGSLDPKAYSSVAIDDKKEAERAVRRLFEHGHRRIAALVAHRDDKSISELRFAGYVQALQTLGLPFDEALVMCAGSFDMPDAYAAAIRLIESDRSFSALFAISDAMAVAAIKALHDRGRRVPEDCSVISIDGIELSEYTVPALTTLEQPAGVIGRHSAQILAGLIESGENRHVVLEAAMRPGESVCGVREGRP